MTEATRQVTVTISNKELLKFFTDAISKPAHVSRGQERTFYRALGHLIGISDTEAVKFANRWARKDDLPTISTDEFRKWLPTVLAAFAASVLSDRCQHG